MSAAAASVPARCVTSISVPERRRLARDLPHDLVRNRGDPPLAAGAALMRDPPERVIDRFRRISPSACDGYANHVRPGPSRGTVAL